MALSVQKVLHQSAFTATGTTILEMLNKHKIEVPLRFFFSTMCKIEIDGKSQDLFYCAVVMPQETILSDYKAIKRGGEVCNGPNKAIELLVSEETYYALLELQEALLDDTTKDYDSEQQKMVNRLDKTHGTALSAIFENKDKEE